VLAIRDDVHQMIDIERVFSKRVRRHLPVHNFGRDVGVVRCDLSPARFTAVSRDACEADKFIGKCLD
jgi:hypothetical protein